MGIISLTGCGRWKAMVCGLDITTVESNLVIRSSVRNETRILPCSLAKALGKLEEGQRVRKVCFPFLSVVFPAYMVVELCPLASPCF